MLTWNATPEQIEQAAHEVGVRTSGCTKTGRGWRFTLKTDTSRFGYPDKDGEGGAPYRRISQSYGQDTESGRPRTVPGAVCWHGHRDFFRALYRLAPDARIKTTMADYRGSEDFEASYKDTQEAVPDSPWMNRRPYQQACYCPDEEED